MVPCAAQEGRRVKTTALRYGLLASLLAALSALGHEPTLAHRFADVNGVRRLCCKNW
jgi:hypothetical protein